MCVHLTYEEFVQELRNWIIKAAHLPEDYVFFKKKAKSGITANGDRLFVVCAETDSGKVQKTWDSSGGRRMFFGFCERTGGIFSETVTFGI